MAIVTAALVKELRERTGAGMMDCKKALQETQGDIELAIDNMRKSGQAKAAKKAGRTTTEGLILAKTVANKAFMLEVNCETDFVSRDDSFRAFANQVIDLAAEKDLNDIEALKSLNLADGQTIEMTLNNLIAKIGENMSLRRIGALSGESVGVYVHNDRIGVLVGLKGGDAKLARDIGVHIAASSPQFIDASAVSTEVIERERAIQIELAMNSGKAPEVAEKMVEGRMKKFANEISLMGQSFVKDPSMTIEQLLKNNGDVKVEQFIRFEVGEGIERKSGDFAQEVQAQIAAVQSK